MEHANGKCNSKIEKGIEGKGAAAACTRGLIKCNVTTMVLFLDFAFTARWRVAGRLRRSLDGLNWRRLVASTKGERFCNASHIAGYKMLNADSKFFVRQRGNKDDEDETKEE